MGKYFIIVLSIIIGCCYCIDLSGQEPETDAVFLMVAKEYRLNEDGSMEIRHSKELKILTHFAFHSLYGESFVIYDPRYQKLQINEAYTIMADGKKVITPSNAFNEVLPRFASNFTALNPLREMVITHTGLEVGAVIHLDYTIHTDAEYFPALMANELLVTSSPIDKQVITVDIPGNGALYHKTVNIRTAPEIFKENGRTRFVWTFTSLPARSRESFQPDDPEQLPILIFSTASNLQEIISTISSQEAFRMNVSEEMGARVQALTDLKKSPLQSILDIQKLVVEEFNLFDVPLEYTGYRLRTAEEIWSGNGGTEGEKGVLLCALFKKAGFPAVLHAVIPRGIMDPSIGCLAAITGFVVEVATKEYGSILLSPVRLNDQNLMYDLSGNTLVKIDPETESLDLNDVPDQRGTVNADFQLKIDDEYKLTGTVSANLEMAMNPFLDFISNENSAKGLWTSFASAGFIKTFEAIASSPEQSSLT